MIYGPKPGQPPAFNIDDIHVCAATTAGFRAVLITGAPTPKRALEAVQVLITELADWLHLHDLVPVTDDRFTRFHRIGRTTAHPAEPGQWPFTFTVDPDGPVFLYPIPHKDLTTITGELVVPTPPPLFSTPNLDYHDAEPRSAAGRLGMHLTSLLALHRISAAVHASADDRTYHAAGNNQTLTARICPETNLPQDQHRHWAQAVLAAIASIPHITADAIDLDGPAAEVAITYRGPAKPWHAS